MAYNTGNAIGSADARDLYDNAQNLDKAMNSTDATWVDRLGVVRPTLKGPESELNQKVADAEAAATQALGYLNTMRATSYGPLAEDPTTDPLENPCTAGDEYFNTTYNLLKRFDGSAWRVPDINTTNLASGAGSSMVGHGGQTVEAALNERLPEIGNYAALRAYTGPVTGLFVRGVANIFDGGFGPFRVDADDTTSLDNGGTIIVDALGRRWKRIYSGGLNVKWFGAVGNGATDDTAALGLAAAALQSGKSLDFDDGTYLISYLGDPYSSVYGNVVIDIIGKSDISFIGNRATIKVINHDIATNGGLRFANFKGCKRVRVAGLNFDMTFTGVNTNANFYPFCGSLTAIDDDAATPDFATLNSDFIVEKCTFKLFHPYGCWALSGAPIAGDPNNGYKLFSLFAAGPHTPTNQDNMCRNLKIMDCTWLEGHNGYGIWTWAWNDVEVASNEAESWATKYSNAAGVYQGGGVPLIRNIPFWASGYIVKNNKFRSRPAAGRTGYFAGKAQFYSQANNMGAVAKTYGETLIEGNKVINGGGSGFIDQCIFFNEFGDVKVIGNEFNGHVGQSAAVGAEVIYFAPTEGGGAGQCSLTVSGNRFGADLHGGIYFANGSNDSAAGRQCRSLVVTGNKQHSGDFFLRMAAYSYKTYEGCPYTVITDNVIDGTITSSWAPPSANNYGIAYAANVAGDVGIIANNVFINKTEAIKTEATYCSTVASLQRYGNSYYGISTPYNAANQFPADRLSIQQIKFPTTPVLSSDANTLDDYEEGTFTPTIIGTGSAGTGTYTTQIGRYQKIGNRVHFTIALEWTAHTGTTNMLVAGLPFTSSTIAGILQPCAVASSGIALTAGNYLAAGIQSNSSQIYLYQVATGAGGLGLVPIDTAGSLWLSGHYEVSV